MRCMNWFQILGDLHFLEVLQVCDLFIQEEDLAENNLGIKLASVTE